MISVKNHSDPAEMSNNLQSRIVEDRDSREPKQTHTRTKNSDDQLANEIISIEKPLYENDIESAEPSTLVRVSDTIEAESIVLDLSLDLAGSSHVDEAGNIESPYDTSRPYDPSYELRKKKSSLAVSDSSNDDDNDPRKKRLKCLQYVGLFACATFLTIFVVYYGSEHEGVRVFGGLSEMSRNNDLADTYDILDATITEILLNNPDPERKEAKSQRTAGDTETFLQIAQ